MITGFCVVSPVDHMKMVDVSVGQSPTTVAVMSQISPQLGLGVTVTSGCCATALSPQKTSRMTERHVVTHFLVDFNINNLFLPEGVIDEKTKILLLIDACQPLGICFLKTDCACLRELAGHQIGIFFSTSFDVDNKFVLRHYGPRPYKKNTVSRELLAGDILYGFV